VDDVVAIREKTKGNDRVKNSVESVARRGVPEWLELDPAKLSGNVKRLPSRDDFTLPVDEQLIIEFYSKL
jgi:small subunit ribosomal protein S4